MSRRNGGGKGSTGSVKECGKWKQGAAQEAERMRETEAGAAKRSVKEYGKRK